MIPSVLRVPNRLALVLTTFLLTLLAASPARAQARFPAANAVVFDPHDSKTTLVRTTFGLLLTHDSGDTWRWICDRAAGAAGSEDPTWLITPKGTLVGGTGAGVAVSRDGGCTFTHGTEMLKGLAMRADGELVGVTSRGESGAFDNHLVVSKDDAQTFVVSGGPIEEALAVETLAVAASDPARLYLSGTRGEGEARAAGFFVSSDSGATWTAGKLALVGAETSVTIAGVDPKNADRVYVRTSGAADVDARLLVSDDAGKTWRKIFDGKGPSLGVALSDDGKRIFAGTRDGVSAAPSDTLAFTKGSSSESQCLASSGNALWSCSTEKSGFFVGISRSGGRSFDAKLHLDEIKGPLDCPAESGVGKECVAAYPKLRSQLGLPDVDEKPRSTGGGGPALRGRATRTGRSRGGFAAFAGIALVGYIAWNVLKRLRRR